MTNLEDAEMSMHQRTHQLFIDNADVIKDDVALKAVVDEFTTNYEAELKYGPILATDTTTYSTEKGVLRGVMIEEAIDLASYAYVGLTKAGKTKEAEQLSIHASDYKVSDNDAGDVANANLELMKLQAAVISPNYVTAAALTTFENNIKAFMDAKGVAQTMVKSTPAQRVEFKAALAKTNENIFHIRILAKKYSKTNTLFYNQLMDNTSVVLTNISHTSLSATLSAKADGHKIAGAVACIDNSKKTATSNAIGELILDEIMNGERILTITAAGFKPFTQTLKIAKGKDNHVEVVMEEA